MDQSNSQQRDAAPATVGDAVRPSEHSRAPGAFFRNLNAPYDPDRAAAFPALGLAIIFAFYGAVMLGAGFGLAVWIM